jgi:hypothetical protein
MTAEKPLSKEFFVDITWGIVFSLITCGLYNIYWNARQFRAMNALLGREEYKFWAWILLSVFTCGLFHIYYEYKMGSDLHAFMTSKGIPVNQNLAVIGLVLSCFGLTIVSDAIYQHELHRLVQ